MGEAEERKKAAVDLYRLLEAAQSGLSEEQKEENHREFMRRGRAVAARKA
jgi:hypothetical protein